MGVPGLWNIIDECGSKVDLKSLEGLRLAIDVSIWIYQSDETVQFQKSGSASHLILLIKRISKLLFYKIRPVFVFDGPNIPDVKRKTLSNRKLQQYINEDRKKAKIFQDFLVKQKLPSSSKGKLNDIFELTSSPESSKKSASSDKKEKNDTSTRDEVMELIKKKNEFRRKRLPESELEKDAVGFSEGQLSRLLKRRRYEKKIEDLIDNKSNEILGKKDMSKNYDVIIDPVFGIHTISKQNKSPEKVEMRTDKPCFSITALQNFGEAECLKKRPSNDNNKIGHQDEELDEESDESDWEDVVTCEDIPDFEDNEESNLSSYDYSEENSQDIIPSRNKVVDDAMLLNEKYGEWKQVLDALGLPYITAYGEAEAECVNLEKAKLVDGIITDDSDVFLFGCQKVYKNMFSRSKEMKCFKMSMISDKLNYNRFAFISMAMFSGGDYSEGFCGIGIKSAEKIIHEFSEKKEIINLNSYNDIIDICCRFKKFIRENGSRPVVSQRRMVILNNFFKQKEENLKLLTSFPSNDAVKEYCNPKCLQSLPEKFIWSRINYVLLQSTFLSKINWTIDEFHKNTFNSFSKWDELMSSDMFLRCSLYSMYLSIILLYFITQQHTSLAVDSLYALTDPVLQLNVKNFNDTVYNQVKPKAYFIQFYSAWCGHCQHYKPTWLEFARHLESWRDVVPITVINCADEINEKVCREHAIEAFPTIKYFKFGSKNKNDSIIYEGDKYQVHSMTKDLAKLVYNDWIQQNRPPNFATFNEISNSNSNLEGLFNSNNNDNKYIAIIIEKIPTPLSYALSIYYNSDPRITIYHSTLDQPLTSSLKQSIIEYNLPKVLVYKKMSDVPVYTSEDRIDNVFNVVEKINEILSDTILVAHQPKLAVEMKEKDLVKPIVPVNLNQFKLQYGDLLSAIKYMLYTEIPRKPVLDGVKLQSLKSWIHMLKKYVPGTTPIKRFFYRLDEWLQLKPNAITADEWIVKINELQLQLGNPIPYTINWVACKGSKSYLRGYTCGLWSLMHTITVEAYTSSKDDPNFNPKNDVLEPIKGFIVNYLSCEICAKNFQHMTEKNHLELVTRPEDVILWLWRAHNNVNRRLSGEASEDPMYPKRQFPNKEICPECIIDEEKGTYDEGITLNYLLKYYQTIHKDGLTNEPAYKLLEFENDLHRNNVASTTSGRSTSIIWLIIVGIMCLIIYTKYRQNRYKVWKIINNYNDYKIFGRDSATGGKGKYEV
uniref:Sulfhydryl oxidase n=1 Tax=Strongyloides stercoralis TaxID=6248 RepID=A0A0K0E7E0_STRER